MFDRVWCSLAVFCHYIAGPADHSAVMRRQRFCHLTTAAQQQLTTEAAAQPPHTLRQSEIPIPQRHAAANGMFPLDDRREQQQRQAGAQQLEHEGVELLGMNKGVLISDTATYPGSSAWPKLHIHPL